VSPINDDTAVLPPVEDTDEPVEDPRDDSLAAELAKAAPRRWWNRATIILGAAALLVGGFVGGAQAQKNWGTAPAAATARGGFPAGGFAGANRAGGTGRGVTPTATAAAPGTSGTVKLVDGNTIYVQTADGATVVVKTDAKTSVRTSAKSTIKTVKAGDTVTVAGAPDTDGTVTATTVTAESK